MGYLERRQDLQEMEQLLNGMYGKREALYDYVVTLIGIVSEMNELLGPDDKEPTP